jgi:hypothetical protein
LSTLNEALFGASSTTNPITARYRLDVPTRERLVVLLASNDDDDATLPAAEVKDFSYIDQALKYQGVNVTQWTYIVLKVKYVARRSVTQRAHGEYDTPWSTVIHSQLTSLPVR